MLRKGRGAYWHVGTSNWNAVCTAGVVGAALAAVESRKDRAVYVAAAERSMEFFLSGFTDDGYCSEGMGYWNYGFGHFVMLSETLVQATGGKLDLLANKKAAHRKGKVQLIDASQWFQPLRRNLGKKNCELSEADIARILDLYLGQPQETAESKWFDNADFGYWKITVERPLRLKSQLSDERIEPLRFASGDEALRAEIYATHGEALYTEFAKRKPAIEAWLKGEDEDASDSEDDEDSGDASEALTARKSVPAPRRKKLLDASTWLRDKALMEVAQRAQQALGRAVFDDHNIFRERFEETLKAQGERLSAAEKKAIYKAVSWRDETSPPVVARRSKLKAGEHFEPGFDGRYLETVGKERYLVEYEPDPELRDTEQVPLKEPGGIDAFFEREVLPHAPDAWIARDKTQTGYEISFARYFYKPAPLRTLDEIRADLLRVVAESEGLLKKIVGGA
jgi:type I restriction enzyme M protein